MGSNVARVVYPIPPPPNRFEVLPFFKKSAVAGAVIKMQLIPNGQFKKIERVFHIIDDREAIDRHVDNEKRSE